jgi:hypothetical protein
MSFSNENVATGRYCPSRFPSCLTDSAFPRGARRGVQNRGRMHASISVMAVLLSAYSSAASSPAWRVLRYARNRTSAAEMASFGRRRSALLLLKYARRGRPSACPIARASIAACRLLSQPPPVLSRRLPPSGRQARRAQPGSRRREPARFAGRRRADTLARGFGGRSLLTDFN